jgi:hypothetical protein
MQWETGQAIKEPLMNTHCPNVDRSECYEVKTVPVIFDISHKEGYLTGGQNLTVRGHGFNGTVTATVDGVACEVTAQREGAFDCKVGTKAAVSAVDTPQVGQRGLRQTVYDASNSGEVNNYLNIEDLSRVRDRLAPQFETFRDQGDYTANVFKGWFTPPATGEYRFYQACDDNCALKLGTTPDQSETTETLLDIHGHTYVRWYYQGGYDGKERISAWKTLTAGQRYYIEAEHQEWTGGDFMTVAVELKQDTLDPDHPHHVMEQQLLVGGVTPQFETVRVKVANAGMEDKGTFRLEFRNPNTNKRSASGELKANMNGDQFRRGVNDYYRGAGFGDVTVVRKRFSAGDAEVETDEETAYVTYDITLRKHIKGSSTDGLPSAKKGTAKSALSVELIQASGAPITGKFRIRCDDAQRATDNRPVVYTHALDWGSSSHTI